MKLTIHGEFENGHMLKSTFIVSVSTLFVNGISFLLMMLAAKTMSVADFATLSLSVSLSFILTTLLDFGVNLTLVRIFSVTKNTEFIDGAMTIKWLTFVLAIFFTTIGFTLSSTVNDYFSIASLGLLGAAVMNLWGGCRAIEQIRQNFILYARNNFIFAIIRMLLGLISLWLGQGIVAFYISAFVLPGCIFVFSHYVFGKEYSISVYALQMVSNHIRQYSTWVFLSSIFYGVIIYIPQFVIAHRLSDIAVSSYGIALTFLGVVTLIATAVRTVLLPSLLTNNSSCLVQLLKYKLIKLFPLYFIGSCILLGVGGFTIEYWYDEVFPDADLTFIICGAGLLGTVYVGFFNLAIHVLGIPIVDTLSNLLRLSVMSVALLFFGDSTLHVAMIFSVTLILGELITTIVVLSMYRSKFCESL